MALYNKFPEPVGSYIVGRTSKDFKYTASDTKEREMAAHIFYPADCSDGKPEAEYAFPELPSMRAELLAKLGNPADEQINISIKTCCYDGLALSGKEEQYPVLFYVHGGASYPQQGTVICQDLASLGYIVISIGHPGGGMFKLGDGRLVNLTGGFMEDILKYSAEAAALMIPRIAELTGGKLDKERAVEISRELTAAPEATRFAEYARLQSEDIGHVADYLHGLSESGGLSFLRGRLKLDIGMGVLGHSFGGTTSAITCRDDGRFACGVNFDGNYLGCLDCDIKTPFMQLGTAIMYNTNAFILDSCSEDFYMLIIDNTHHYDFGDHLFTVGNEAFKGARDVMETRKIITAYTAAFFDRHLLKKEAEIESLAFEGVEMIKV